MIIDFSNPLHIFLVVGVAIYGVFFLREQLRKTQTNSSLQGTLVNWLIRIVGVVLVFLLLGDRIGKDSFVNLFPSAIFAWIVYAINVGMTKSLLNYASLSDESKEKDKDIQKEYHYGGCMIIALWLAAVFMPGILGGSAWLTMSMIGAVVGGFTNKLTNRSKDIDQWRVTMFEKK